MHQRVSLRHQFKFKFMKICQARSHGGFEGFVRTPQNFANKPICIEYSSSRHFKLQNKLKFVQIGPVEVEIWLFEIDAVCPGPRGVL